MLTITLWPVEVRKSVEYAESYQTNLKGPKTSLDLSDSDFAGENERYQGRRWVSRYNNGMVDSAPINSRWTALVDAMNGFFDVLEQTDQQEQVALIVFSSSTQAESVLTADYDVLREIVAGIVPIGGTQIGEGLRSGLREVVNYEGSEPANSRPFAEKMIVVMTDGRQNDGGLEPVPVARSFKQEHPESIIHTVTFGEGAEVEPMIEVAEVGGGNHYHADNAGELADEFREIANIPPTIFTY